MGQTPRLEEVIEAAINERLASFWTAIPARVQSYDSGTQTATIAITITNAVKDSKGKKHWTNPIINNVAVMFPGSTYSLDSNDHFRITFPVGSLTTGLYMVSTLPTGGWRQSNGRTNVNIDHPPGSTNHLSSGFFIPAEIRNPGTSTDAPTDAMVLHGPTIKIGGTTGTSPVVVQSALNDFMYALNEAIIAGPTTGLQALTYLQTQLQALNSAAGWKARTTKTRAK